MASCNIFPFSSKRVSLINFFDEYLSSESFTTGWLLTNEFLIFNSSS